GEVALEGIAEAAAARALHDHDVTGLEREAADLAGQGRGLDHPGAAADPEAVGGAGLAPPHAERRQHRLLGPHREPGAGRPAPHLAGEAEASSPPAGPAGVLPQRRALDPHRVELLDGLDRLERGHVALGPRPDGAAAVAALEAAGAPGRVLVED